MARLSQNDRARIALFERYTHLPANWVNALAGANEKRGAKRLRMLADGHPDRPGQALLHRHFEMGRHRVYSRTDKGDKLAGKHPLRTNQNFAHQILQDLVHASIELGLKANSEFDYQFWPSLRDDGWTEHGAHKSVPAATLAQPDPHAIKLTSGRSRADGAPFRIGHNGEQYFFLGTEIDRSTEHLTGPNTRRTLEQKVLHYKDIFEHDRFKHYGFPHGFIIFVFIEEKREEAFHQLVAKHFKKNKCREILTIVTKDWANERSYPPPSSDFFTHPCKRVGYPDFYLNR